MKVGFYHDAPLVNHDGKYYSIGFSAEVWQRYLEIFDELQVSTRVQFAEPSNHALSSRPNVTFKPISNYSNLRSLALNPRGIIKQIEQSLAIVECAIIRLPSIIGWLTVPIARRMKKPVLIELVGCPWDAFRSKGKLGPVFAGIAYLITKSMVYRSQHTIYVTKHFLQKRYPSTGITASISNVEITLDESVLNRQSKKLINRSDVLRIGSVGKVDIPYKGYESALHAVKILADDGQQVCYEIVGPGNPTKLRDLSHHLGIASFVHLKGPMTRQELDSWRETLDIYVQPSLSEGLPRSAIEAMSKALPLLLSDAGGNPELVIERYVYPAGNSVALAQKIKQMSNSDLAEIGRNNFNFSREFEKSRLQATRNEILKSFRKHVELITGNS